MGGRHGGDDVHQSHAIVFSSAENCWIRRVNSWCPPGSSPDNHIGVQWRQIPAQPSDHSGGLRLASPRHYKGGGGNGYLYTLHWQRLPSFMPAGLRMAVTTTTLRQPPATGNVLHDCLARMVSWAPTSICISRFPTCVDNMTCDGDFLEAKFRPWGGTPIRDVTTSQTDFLEYKRSAAYIASPFEYAGKMHDRPRILIQSEQFGDGLSVIGPADRRMP